MGAATILASCGTRRAAELIAEVPFTSPRHQVVVQVTLEGQGPYAMLLDTGTDPSVIDAALALKLRAPSDTTRHPGQGGGSGPIRAFEWEMHDLRLGAVSARRVPAAALDLSQLREKLAAPIQGVLGFSFLANRIVQIDYPRHRVRFYRGAAPGPTGSGFAELRFDYNSVDATPRFPARVGDHEVKLLYDSGSSGTLSIAGLAVQRLGLDSAFARARVDSAFGYGGRVETRTGSVPELSLGPFRYTDVACTFGVKAFGALDDTTRVMGKVGNAIFEDAVVTLDYPRRRMRIERSGKD